MFRRVVGLLMAAAALALVVAGIAGASSAKSTSKLKKQAKIAKMVPAKIRSKGSLVVASDATYAPMEFIAKDGKTVIGVDADLAKALGTVMGVKMKVQNASFDGIIPGLKAGKYGVGMSSFTDTKARQKVVDFVTYFSAGTSFYVKASGGPSVTGLASLCGKSVAVENGTTEQADASAQNKKCKSGGKPGVTVKAYPDQNAANLAISSGRQQVGMADSPVAAYIVKQSHGQFKLAGKSYGTAPYGIALPKKSGMAKPMLAAVKYLMKQGTYETILKKWGVQKGAISNPKINGAIS
jgi:polar amino acid transport system substrate-binding protein